MIKNVIKVLIFLLIILCVPINALAAENVYVVQTGDTLYKIACEHNTTVDNIKVINQLTSDLIYPGSQLKIPTENNGISTPTVYIVKRGDCLSNIAANFGITVSSLKMANNLSSDLIQEGDKLIIAVSGQSVSRAATIINGGMIVDEAAKYLGTPYVYGGEKPGGFDCSGFVQYVFSRFGYRLPRTAAAQYNLGKIVNKSDLQVGDLVFFKCHSRNIDHVGIYVGNNQFIHSSSPRSGGVIYTSLEENFYVRSYTGAKRIIK